jgi:2-polyprenyl-3-methyl-5-hydroxy-6-metoxy-1,4-benzoquinol methylase
MKSEQERRREGRERARAVAAPYLARGDGVSWFDAFYRDAHGDPALVPWADREGHPQLVEWIEAGAYRAEGRRALVVGCGLGEDAELVSRAGFDVTGFDVSPTAIEMAREFWPGSHVTYVSADVFDPPAEWLQAFDLVVEVYTIQALPTEMQSAARAAVASFVAPGGRLLVVTCGVPQDEPRRAEIPWPQTRADLRGFAELGLSEVEFFEAPTPDDDIAPVRWRAVFEKPRG